MEKDLVFELKDLVLENIMLVNAQTNQELKVKFELNKVDDGIALVGKAGSSPKQYAFKFSIPEFDQILTECVESEKELFLENQSDFKKALSEIVSLVIKDRAEENHEFFTRNNQKELLHSGVGVIVSTATKSEIGTFEDVQFIKLSNGFLDTTFSSIHLRGKTVDQLVKELGVEFVYYDLSYNLIFTFKVTKSKAEKISSSPLDECIFANRVNLTCESFSSNHPKRKMIEDAILHKIDVSTIEPSNSISMLKFEEYREKRLTLIDESKIRKRKEKLISQIADIEL